LAVKSWDFYPPFVQMRAICFNRLAVRILLYSSLLPFNCLSGRGDSPYPDSCILGSTFIFNRWF